MEVNQNGKAQAHHMRLTNINSSDQLIKWVEDHFMYGSFFFILPSKKRGLETSRRGAQVRRMFHSFCGTRGLWYISLPNTSHRQRREQRNQDLGCWFLGLGRKDCPYRICSLVQILKIKFNSEGFHFCIYKHRSTRITSSIYVSFVCPPSSS
jgi:hypothetical protein